MTPSPHRTETDKKHPAGALPAAEALVNPRMPAAPRNASSAHTGYTTAPKQFPRCHKDANHRTPRTRTRAATAHPFFYQTARENQVTMKKIPQLYAAHTKKKLFHPVTTINHQFIPIRTPEPDKVGSTNEQTKSRL